jgi:hypothetical protein
LKPEYHLSYSHKYNKNLHLIPSIEVSISGLSLEDIGHTTTRGEFSLKSPIPEQSMYLVEMSWTKSLIVLGKFFVVGVSTGTKNCTLLGFNGCLGFDWFFFGILSIVRRR